MFIVIWKYEVSKIFKKDFEELYGQNGKWVKLFQTSKGYLETQLIKDVSESNQYVTIDKWVSQSKYEKFLTENKEQFEIIDAEGENFTTSETKIGWFKN